MHESILILDDDPERSAIHAFGLDCAGFRARRAADAHAAHTEFLRERPDLVLIFCSRVDAPVISLAQAVLTGAPSRRVPVVAVLAQATTDDAASLLEQGFCDCLVGPVAPRTLVDCVHACLSRERSTRVLRYGLKLDVDTGILTRHGTSVVLGPSERRLLATLFEHPERVLSRAQLQRRVRSVRASSAGRVIDISVCRLRQALKRLGCGDILQTIRGRGYRLAMRETRTATPGATSERSADDPEHLFRWFCNQPVFILDYIGATS